MQSSLGKLPDQGRVIIIGGGPAATACGLALKRLAAKAARNVDVVLVEGSSLPANAITTNARVRWRTRTTGIGLSLSAMRRGSCAHLRGKA